MGFGTSLRSKWLSLAAVMGLGAATLNASTIRLPSDTEAGWNAYVAATEARRAGEVNRPDRFLAMAFAPQAPDDLRRLQSGEVVVSIAEATGRDGRALTVPAAAVHHWRGAVFVPGVTVGAIMHALYTRPPIRTDDVLDARVLERGPDRLRVFLKLQRRKIVTATYDTEHAVTFRRHGPARAETVSIATRIAELTGTGTPDERERLAGEDRGFLWRLNAYWRYESVPGGVIAECESVTLSRPVPALVRPAIGPLIDRTARESMERTLVAFRDAFTR